MKKKYQKKLYVLLLCAIIAAGACIPVKPVLSISNRKNHSEKYFISTARMEGFEISYTHSVNKGRIHDRYDVRGPKNVLLLTSTQFVSYGAGIPEPGETPGARFFVTDSGYVIENLNRQVKKLVMAVGLTANHKIKFCFYEGEDPVYIEYAFTDLFEPQTSTVLERKNVSLAAYMMHRLRKTEK